MSLQVNQHWKNENFLALPTSTKFHLRVYIIITIPYYKIFELWSFHASFYIEFTKKVRKSILYVVWEGKSRDVFRLSFISSSPLPTSFLEPRVFNVTNSASWRQENLPADPLNKTANHLIKHSQP